MIFIDHQCPNCHGHGCKQCHGTGSVGRGEELGQQLPTPIPTAFGGALRAWRIEHEMTFRELGVETGIFPSVLSEIEIGRRKPTDEQRKRIEEIMNE